jgi:orotate phosphoribosyltransferase
MTKAERRLLELLHKHSYKESPDRPFRLSSGRTSPYYIDVKSTLSMPEGLYLAGQILYSRIKSFEQHEEVSIDLVGGMEIGAIPVVNAVAFYSYLQHEPIGWFYVRKTPKSHGLQKWVEGSVSTGQKVIILDDVVTTGKSTLNAIQGATDSGLEVAKLIVLVDRLEGGTEELQKTSIPFESVFTIKDLKEYKHLL